VELVNTIFEKIDKVQKVCFEEHKLRYFRYFYGIFNLLKNYG